MSEICCMSGLANFGRGKCPTQIAEIIGMVFTPTYDNDNQLNYIDLTADFGNTEVLALLTSSDLTQWTPSPRLFATSIVPADTVFDEATDGTKSFVRDGILPFATEVRDKDAVPTVQKKLKSYRCKTVSGYPLSRDNQLVGRVSKDGTKLYPLEINSGSIDPKLMFRDAQATNKIMLAFDFDNLVKTEDFYVLQGDDLTTPVDFLRLQKLTDVNITVASHTTTTVVFSVKTDFAQGLIPNNDVIGQDATDFVFTNITDATTITAITVEEDPAIDGQYEATFVAQTATDIVEVSMNTAQNFYRGSKEYTV